MASWAVVPIVLTLIGAEGTHKRYFWLISVHTVSLSSPPPMLQRSQDLCVRGHDSQTEVVDRSSRDSSIRWTLLGNYLYEHRSIGNPSPSQCPLRTGPPEREALGRTRKSHRSTK